MFVVVWCVGVFGVRCLLFGVRFVGVGFGGRCFVWCSMIGARCLVFGAWCLVFVAWCLVFGAWCSIFSVVVWCLVSSVWWLVFWCLVFGDLSLLRVVRWLM